MSDRSLAKAVEGFAARMRGVADEKLDAAWSWQDYTEEGARFAFFRAYEELRTLAAELTTERAETGPMLTTAQRALGQFHAGYRDLQAVLLQADESLLERPPAEGEWPLRRILGHMMGADIGFAVLCRHALAQHRDGQPATPPEDEDWEAFVRDTTGVEIDEFEAFLKEAPSLAALMERWDDLHEKIIAEFSDVTQQELAAPAYYWERSSYPMEFRLHRFDSHLRQHTIQVEKTLAALCGAPSEAQRLLRLVYAALAELEGVLIGAADLGAARRAALADTIDGYAASIEF